jgi:CRISPR-associated protein Csm5
MHSSAISVKTFALTLHPLTPIHVWSGRKLFSGLDVVRKSPDTLCIVDTDRLPPNVVNELLAVRAEDMPKVLEKHSAEVLCKQEVKVAISIPPAVQILELNPYVVPGSTLKGYIRTSVLFHLLKSVGDKSRLSNVLRSGVDLEKEPKFVSEGLEAQFFRAPKPPKQGGFVDSFQSLLVSDPEVLAELKCYSVSELQVVELRAGALKPIANQYAVVVTCGELRYHISIRTPKEGILRLVALSVPEHKGDIEKLYLLEKLNLIEALREFGCHILSKEIEKAKLYKELSNYVKLLESFHARYCEKESNCVIARIGYMTGHTAKTVLSIVKEAEPQLYHQVKSFMESYLHHTWDELTIKLAKTPQGLVGPGWCELCFT